MIIYTVGELESLPVRGGDVARAKESSEKERHATVVEHEEDIGKHVLSIDEKSEESREPRDATSAEVDGVRYYLAKALEKREFATFRRVDTATSATGSDRSG